MKKIILLFITIFSFFGLYSFSNADYLVSSSQNYHALGHFKQSDLNNPYFYGIGGDLNVYSISGSGVSTIPQYVFSTGSWSSLNSYPIYSYIKSYNNDISIFIVVDYGLFYPGPYFYPNVSHVVIVDNVRKRSAKFTYGGNTYFFYNNGNFRFGNGNGTYYSYSWDEIQGDSVDIYNGNVTNPISLPWDGTNNYYSWNGNSSYYYDMIIAKNNNIITCDINSSTYNAYSWDNSGNSNHGSLPIPGTTYSYFFGLFSSTIDFGRNCQMSYDSYNNVAGFSTIIGGVAYSKIYAPGYGTGQFYGVEENKYITSFTSTGTSQVNFEVVNIPDNNINYYYNSNFGYLFYDTYVFNNQKFYIYGTSSNQIYGNFQGSNILGQNSYSPNITQNNIGGNQTGSGGNTGSGGTNNGGNTGSGTNNSGTGIENVLNNAFFNKDKSLIDSFFGDFELSSYFDSLSSFLNFQVQPQNEFTIYFFNSSLNGFEGFNFDLSGDLNFTNYSDYTYDTNNNYIVIFFFILKIFFLFLYYALVYLFIYIVFFPPVFLFTKIISFIQTNTGGFLSFNFNSKMNFIGFLAMVPILLLFLSLFAFFTGLYLNIFISIFSSVFNIIGVLFDLIYSFISGSDRGYFIDLLNSLTAYIYGTLVTIFLALTILKYGRL